jgi:hypothetical protein
MLRSVRELFGYDILAIDGEMGKVSDFLFDDQAMLLRYLVVETGSWFSSKKVLLHPFSLGTPDWESRCFPVDLTMEQVANSPDIDLEKPVSLQHQARLHDYYSWPAYWGPEPVPVPDQPARVPLDQGEPEESDLHLRSCSEVIGYHIHALDGTIGHVEEFIVDDEDWVLRYMVVDTRNWLPGRKVLVSPAWVDNFSWSNSMVYIELLREVIEHGPEYDPSMPIDREYEMMLYDYYGRPRYWE